MKQSKVLFDRKLRVNEWRFVLDINSKAGCYCPIILVFRRGPNNSPAGYGPKGFGSWRGKWIHNLRIPCPHLKWSTAYKLRKVGGLKVYRVINRAYSRAVGN